MDDYKFQQRLHKRGEFCVAALPDRPYGIVCGCGSRTPPNKQHKKKIVRNALKRELRGLASE